MSARSPVLGRYRWFSEGIDRYVFSSAGDVTMLGGLRPIGSGKTISLDKDRILVGSHRLCDVVIYSPHVAPVHCQLVLRGSWWYVRNLDRAVETKLNGLPVTDEKVHPGDILGIGDRHYEVCYDPDELTARLAETPQAS